MSHSTTSSRTFLKTGTWTDLALIALVWIAAIIVVNPVGEFPLNDDWSMATTVKRLVISHDYRPDGWVSMTLISHVLWGALFCVPHGFSFTALRISTLTLSLVGVVAFYLLIRQLHKNRWIAVLGTLLLAFNPIYFALSNTFMTDVPFTAMATLAALFFFRYFQTESLPMLVLATVLAIICTLSRQLGLAIPMAFTLTLLLKHGFKKAQLARALSPTIAVVASWMLFNYWLRSSGRTPAAYDLKTNELMEILHKPITVPLHLLHHGWNALMYLGCFLLPLFAVTTTAMPRRAAFLIKVLFTSFMAVTVARFILMPGLMPVHNNILDPRGIGPFTLRDVQLLRLPDVQPLPKIFWIVATAFSLIGAWILIYRCCIGLTALAFPGEPTGDDAVIEKRPAWWQRTFSNLRISLNHPTEASTRTLAMFFLLCAAIYMAPLVVSGFFDRYLLPTFVFLTAFLAVTAKDSMESPARWPRFAAIFLLAVLACYAVAGTRDYLTWNRVRWAALADLQHANIPPEKIDGGFEFNGWYLYDPKFKVPKGKSDWWVHDDQYLLSFGDLRGYEKLKEYDYSRWLPPSRGQILVLKRNDSAPPASTNK